MFAETCCEFSPCEGNQQRLREAMNSESAVIKMLSLLCTVLLQHITAREVATNSLVLGVQSLRDCNATREEADRQQDLSTLAMKGEETQFRDQ